MTDNQTTELLPCPFCGGETRLKEYKPNVSGVAICEECGARSPICKNDHAGGWKQKAIAAWNTRAELGRLNATSSQESIVRSFLRKISPNRDWDYLGEHEHALIADLVDDIAATLGSEREKALEELVRDLAQYVCADEGIEDIEARMMALGIEVS